MRVIGSVSATVVVLTLAGCAAGSGSGGHEAGAQNPGRPAHTAMSGETTAAGGVQSRAARHQASRGRDTHHRPLPKHYTFPIHRCSASPSSSHHDYPASDIFTQHGCRFVAVTRGTVDEVSFHDRWDPQAD